MSQTLTVVEKLKLLTPAEVAEILGVAEQTLNDWRCTKRVSLTYVKVGRYIRYRAGDVEAFIKAGTVSA